MKIYTKTGDKGTTSLIGGTRVSKADLRLEAYGTADELNSFIGLLRAKIEAGVYSSGQKATSPTLGEEYNAEVGAYPSSVNADVKEIDAVLKRVQNKLFNLGGFLATDTSVCETCEATEIAKAEVELLEKEIDKMQEELPVVRGFILPAGDEVVSLCHVCRTVCRRLERRMVALFSADGLVGEKSENCLQYVNRLSDYLFILSKKEAKLRENALFLWEK